MGDAALALRARGADELAFRRLLDGHNDLVRYLVNRYFASSGLEHADLYQEGLIGFHKAVRDYRHDRGTGFTGFAGMCVERQIITAIKTATRRKHEPLNQSTPLDAPVTDDGLQLLEMVADARAVDPQRQLEIRDDLAQVVGAVQTLTSRERAAVAGRAAGLSYHELATSEGTTWKSIDNASQRAAQKIAACLDPTSSPPPATTCRRSRPASTPPAPRRRQRPAAVAPLPTEQEAKQVSIVESVDAEISTVQEEIAALEQKLDGKRTHLDGLSDLRTRAVALTGVAEAEPSPAPPSSPSSQRQSPEASRVNEERVEAIVKLVAQHPDDGLGSGEIRRQLHLSTNQFAALRHMLPSRLRATGEGRARRYYPKEAAARPKPAPARERRAAPAPARKVETRRNTEAAEAHNALRRHIKEVYLELLAEGPMGQERSAAKVLDLVPEAGPSDVAMVRQKLLEDRVFEIRANKLQLSGVDRSKPITAVEREVVDSLGSGRTAREVASNCKLVRDAFAARTICAALVSRGVIVQRRDSSPPVYEAIDDCAEAA